MRAGVKVVALGLALVWLAAASVYAQQKSDASSTSLGEIARKLKTEKANEHPPVMVITNDNLGGLGKSGVSVAGPGTKENTSNQAPAQAKGSSAPVHDAEYYRAQQRKLQDQLDVHKRELDVLQQKLGQNQVQYYADPYKSLMQQYTREDINKLTADIAAKKDQIAADEKALEDLREELRRDGGDPGWLR
jgi:hypothetical protein